MATILFIGGVGPNVSQEELVAAFAPYTALLASSVVRHPESGRCIGQAYVTVAAEDVRRAIQVEQVGSNSVCVFPVEVDAWVAPAAVQAATPEALSWGPRLALPCPPASGPGSNVEGAGLPSSPHIHLQAALDQLRAHLAVNPSSAYNGKPFYMLLHEACQKRQLTLQVSDSLAEGGALGCSITVMHGNTVVCNGRALGQNKKDAKHNAAACCLDALLAVGQWMSIQDLITYMTTPPASAIPTSFESIPVVGAAASAMTQTNNIMRLGLYPRCAEVMALVHSTDSGRLKTPLMVLNEYAVRARLTVLHDELVAHAGAVAAPAGPFLFQSRLLDMSGKVVAQAKGVEFRSKQEAKQAAAAALLEYVLASSIATVEDMLTRSK